jgi:hypothetical protein
MRAAATAYFLLAAASEEVGMNPGASLYHLSARPAPGGDACAIVIAILFIALAAISFAVDQSVTLSSLP